MPDGKKGFAVLMIALGALILLSKLGFGFGHIMGHLMGWLIPIGIAALGYIGIRNGSKLFGWLFLIVGAFLLLGKLSGLIGLLLAIGMIVYGLSLLKRRKQPQ